VPAKDRLRRDEERSPALSGYEAGQEADENARSDHVKRGRATWRRNTAI
jgi:hypothetical protein